MDGLVRTTLPIDRCMYASAAAPTTLLFCVSLSDLHALIIAVVILLAALASFGFVDRILFVTNSDTTLIVAKIVHASVNVVIYHLTCLQECLLYIECCLGRGLQENESVLLGESLTFLRADLSTVVQIRLVADEHDHYVGVAVLAHLFQPSR